MEGSLGVRVFREATRYERTKRSQNWRIRSGCSGFSGDPSSLREVGLTQTNGARSRHRLSLLRARSASTPASNLSLERPGLLPGADCSHAGGRSLFRPAAGDVSAQTGAGSAHDRYRAGASYTYRRPAQSDRTGGNYADIRNSVETG